jgi:hypothetical protein
MKELLLPELDFSPVPPAKRRSPGRVKSIPARLYIDQYREHREAYKFLQERQKLHGAGGRTLVRSLLFWRDAVADPLEEMRDASGKLAVPKDMRPLLADFQPLRGSGTSIKHVSVRLYIDKWIEHREAYEFIQRQQRLHGEGNKTIVRAILLYRDALHKAEGK